MKTIQKIALPLAAVALMMSIFLLTAFADSGSPAEGQTLVAVSIETVAEFEKSESFLSAGPGTWALMNVILGAVTFVAALAALRIRDGRVKAIAILATAAAIATIALTQNFGEHVILADKWTILMAVYAAGCSALNEIKTSRKA
ncbi:MAG: hypothetical protein J6A42_02740 [Firmicutes bacterium]|nr:hypothetical protein [Bacillota bacterium]